MFSTARMNHWEQAFFSDTKIQWYIKHKNCFQKYIFVFTMESYFCAIFFPLLNQINDYININ